jgi:glucose/arabinose dehydrogenase
MNKRRIVVLGTVAVTSSLLIGVLGASGTPAQQKPKKAPVVLGSSASLKFDLGTDQAILLKPPSSPAVFVPSRIVSTAKLPAGHYEVTATATGRQAVCWLDTHAAVYSVDHPREISVNDTDEDVGLALTAGFKVKNHKRVSEYCGGIEANGVILSGGITAIKVNKNLAGKRGLFNGVGGF